MTDKPAPGDRATVSIRVAVSPDEAFRIFTEEIDQWWRGGRRYRIANAQKRSVVHIESGVGGRLFESFDGKNGPSVVETGRVLAWDPPSRLLLEWRAANFAPHERTEVEVTFEASGDGTMVTVQHRGFGALRPDHPVRHGQAPKAFARSMGMWWADLMSSLREHTATIQPLK